TISVVTGALLVLPLLIAHTAGMTRAGLALLALCAVITASYFAFALVNPAIMALLGPMSLPRLQLRDGVPPELRTLVVVAPLPLGRDLCRVREGRSTGTERKRAKHGTLNRPVPGTSDTMFIAPPRGRLHVPAGVRYVITLDADTRLPRGAATRLVGTMAHPL